MEVPRSRFHNVDDVGTATEFKHDYNRSQRGPSGANCKGPGGEGARGEGARGEGARGEGARGEGAKGEGGRGDGGRVVGGGRGDGGRVVGGGRGDGGRVVGGGRGDGGRVVGGGRDYAAAERYEKHYEDSGHQRDRNSGWRGDGRSGRDDKRVDDRRNEDRRVNDRKGDDRRGERRGERRGDDRRGERRDNDRRGDRREDDRRGERRGDDRRGDRREDDRRDDDRRGDRRGDRREDDRRVERREDRRDENDRYGDSRKGRERRDCEGKHRDESGEGKHRDESGEGRHRDESYREISKGHDSQFEGQSHRNQTKKDSETRDETQSRDGESSHSSKCVKSDIHVDCKLSTSPANENTRPHRQDNNGNDQSLSAQDTTDAVDAGFGSSVDLSDEQLRSENRRRRESFDNDAKEFEELSLQIFSGKTVEDDIPSVEDIKKNECNAIADAVGSSLTTGGNLKRHSEDIDKKVTTKKEKLQDSAIDDEDTFVEDLISNVFNVGSAEIAKSDQKDDNESRELNSPNVVGLFNSINCKRWNAITRLFLLSNIYYRTTWKGKLGLLSHGEWFVNMWEIALHSIRYYINRNIIALYLYII